ncbi:MAG: hypothetical protein HUU01_08670, partial [Saprospiraceae bacterium]|nr:hypothetical protein [Saprospiraceae bacterium]
LYVTTGLIAINTALVLFAMDFLKDRETKDSIRLDWSFNFGLAICLSCLPILGFLSYLLSMIDETTSDEDFENKVRVVIAVSMVFWLVDCIGIVFIQHPFYASGHSFTNYSIIGFFAGLVVFISLNYYLRKG